MDRFNFEQLKLSTSDYSVLERGFKTEVEENGEVIAVHYHFVGSPFSGLWKKKMTKNQILKSEEKRQNSGRTIKKGKNKPAMTAIKTDDGWNFIMNKTANVDDVKFVSENNFNIVKVKKLKLRNYIRMRLAQERNQVPFVVLPVVYEIIPDLDALEAEYSFGQVQQQNHNREMHSGNGNMMREARAKKLSRNTDDDNRQQCKVPQAVLDKIHHERVHSSKIELELCKYDAISKFNEFCQQTDVLEYSETVRVTQYNERPGWFVTVYAVINNKKFVGNGTALQKKEAKREACKMLLINVELDKIDTQMEKMSLSKQDVETITACDCVNENILIPSLLVIGGVEQNPGPQNECLNVKRDSKTHRHQGKKTRIERLQNSHPEYALKLTEKEEFNRLKKIYAKQLEQERKGINKCIDKLTAHSGFAVPVKISFPQFNELFENLIKGIPKEFVDNIKWVDVSMAVYELFNTSSFASKWLACRIIYLEFGLQTMSIGVFGGLVFQLLKKIGCLNQDEAHAAEKKLKVHIVEASPMAIVVTLLLSIIFKQRPKENTIEKVLGACRDVSTTSSGLEMVMSAAKKTLEFVSGSYEDDNTIEYRVNKITKKVKEYLTPQGQKSLETNQGAFEEIALLKIEALELCKFIRPHTTLGIHFNQVNYNLNRLYNQSQILSSSGHGYRKRPVVFHMHGGAGIGKTRLINLFSSDLISTILQLEDSKYLQPANAAELNEKVSKYEQFVYFRPVGLKYQQNFNTHYSKIYVCDDANQIAPSFQAGETTYPMELIHLNNSHDHMLNVAEIEHKKNALFRSSLVIATDNIETPDLYYLVCPEAYERRIDFSFKVQIKPEFAKEETLRNNKKILTVNKQLLDRSQANTHIYEFVDSQKNVFSYDQVVKLLEDKLIEINKDHDVDIKLFKERAITRVADRANPVNNPLRETMRSHYNESLNVHSKGPLPRNLGEALAEEKVPFHVRCKTFMIALMLYFISWERVIKIESVFLEKFSRSKEMFRNNKRKILITTGILTALVVGYFIYKKSFKSQKRYRFGDSTRTEGEDNEREEENEVDGKYDSGQAKKSVPKGKAPSNKPIKSVPLHSNTVAVKQTIEDIGEFMSKPDTQIACQRAYSMIKILCSNAYYIYFDYIRDGKKVSGGLRGFFLKGGIFITNRHLLPDDEKEYRSGHFNLYNIHNKYLDIPVNKVSVNTFAHEDDENDLFYDLIWIDFGKNVKIHFDLSQYGQSDLNFIKESQFQELVGVKILVFTLSISVEFAENEHKQAITTGKANWIGEVQHTKITEIVQEAMTCVGREGEDLYTWKTMEYPMQSTPGYCGSVVITNDAEYQGKILGIHMAGYSCRDSSYGQMISFEMIDSILSCNVHLKMKNGVYNTVISPNDFSFIRTVPHTLRSPNKTKLRKSICHNKIFVTQKAPAKMGFAPDGEHVMYKAMKKYLTPHYTLSHDQESIFSSIILTKFQPHRKIRELNRVEAIKGIEGNEYICPINRKSSAGYPLNVETKKTGKREYLGEDDAWIFDHPRVEQLINEFQIAVKEKQRPEIAFVATIKDELVKIQKAEIYKSRAFAAAPLHFTILFREKYLDFFATVMECRIKNFSLVGTNMYSDDVDTIVKLLTEVAPPKSKQFLAGDFTNFDGTLCLNMLWQIYNVIEQMYGRNHKLCEALWLELVDSQQLFGNTVIHVPRGQPSGNPATTLINTLYNIALMFMTLFEVMEEINTVASYTIQDNLLDHFRGVFYGDDNALSFTKAFTTITDPNLLTKVMAKYGHVYTTDAKDTSIFEYKDLSEISILKRRFTFDQRLRCWIAPLELVSILEPINWDKEDRTEMKEMQMQVNIRTAIRELSLHETEVFNEYSKKLINFADKYGLELTPDCRFTQNKIREMVRRSDNVFFFSNDYYNEYETNFYNIDNDLELEQGGRVIQLGKRLDGSPIKDLQKPTVHMLNPTVNSHQWIAKTYEQVKQESNNKRMHAGNGNYSFSGSGSNGAAISFQIPSIPENSLVSISLSASADSERSGTVLVKSDWFDIGARFEAQTTTTQQLTTLPRGVTNAVAHITTTATSTCRFVFTLNVSPPLPTNATVPEPLWVRQYESGEPTREIPQVHMMQYRGPAEEEISDDQIATLDTVTPLKNESVPRHVELDLEKLKAMSETRDHSVKDILCRLYAIRDIELPAGGTTNTPIVELDLLAELLSQVNIAAKLEGFAVLRTNLIVTIITRTLATTSGGLIASFFPQFSDLTNRNLNILQNSQTPNKRINLAGSEGIRMLIPFISAFYGKNLVTDSGSIGMFVLKQLTQLNINSSSLRIYIQADDKNVSIEYPTFAVGEGSLRRLQLQLNDLYQEQAQALRNVRMHLGNAQRLHGEANNRLPLEIRENVPDLIPRVHMKKMSQKPVKSVKWVPGMNQLNKDGEDISHSLSMSRNNEVRKSKGQFGTGLDEMTIDHIGKSQQIISVERVSTSDVANTVVFARPCTIVDFMEIDGKVFLTHQSWIAMKAQKWAAKLHFEITTYINNFHSVTLRAIFNANDTGNFSKGDILNYNQINKAKSMLMEFDGQCMIKQFVVEPELSSAIKNVPTPRLGSVNANVADWLASCFTEECSYGMFYLIIEVPLHAASQVAPHFDFTVDFHVSDLLLGDPCEFDQLLPSVHMMKSGLTSEVAETSRQQTRSDVFEKADEVKENAAVPSNRYTVNECLGDNITHLKDLLSVFTPFCQIKHVTVGNALQINPFIFRALQDMPVADRFHNSDSIDYFSAGFGYYQGGMDIRIGKTTEQQGPFGEVMLTSARNRSVPIASTSGTGTAIIPAANSARGGCRVLPLYKEECIPQVNIPYYQPFHIARITNSNSFNSGNQPKIMLLRPYNAEYYRIFRAARSDFHFGFLTALPPFELVVGSMYD